MSVLKEERLVKLTRISMPKNELFIRFFSGWGKGKCAANRLMQIVSKGSSIFIFFHKSDSIIFLTFKLTKFKYLSWTSDLKIKQENTITS